MVSKYISKLFLSLQTTDLRWHRSRPIVGQKALMTVTISLSSRTMKKMEPPKWQLNASAVLITLQCICQ